MRYRVDRAWAILWTLCVTEIVSWGVLVYSPAVFLLPMRCRSAAGSIDTGYARS